MHNRILFRLRAKCELRDRRKLTYSLSVCIPALKFNHGSSLPRDLQPPIPADRNPFKTDTKFCQIELLPFASLSPTHPSVFRFPFSPTSFQKDKRGLVRGTAGGRLVTIGETWGIGGGRLILSPNWALDWILLIKRNLSNFPFFGRCYFYRRWKREGNFLVPDIFL